MDIVFFRDKFNGINKTLGPAVMRRGNWLTPLSGGKGVAHTQGWGPIGIVLDPWGPSPKPHTHTQHAGSQQGIPGKTFRRKVHGAGHRSPGKGVPYPPHGRAPRSDGETRRDVSAQSDTRETAVSAPPGRNNGGGAHTLLGSDDPGPKSHKVQNQDRPGPSRLRPRSWPPLVTRVGCGRGRWALVL